MFYTCMRVHRTVRESIVAKTYDGITLAHRVHITLAHYKTVLIDYGIMIA